MAPGCDRAWQRRCRTGHTGIAVEVGRGRDDRHDAGVSRSLRRAAL